MKKIVVLMLLVAMLTSLPVLAACGSGGTDVAPGGGSSKTAPTTASTNAPADKTFTQSELAQYDGLDGQPAYVAVDGVVYDVSASSLWREGRHITCALGAVAGKDLTSVIAQAPSNMRSLLQTMPVVGHLDQ